MPWLPTRRHWVSSMDERLQVLLDKQEITELVHAYCNASDRHDHDKLRQLYREAYAYGIHRERVTDGDFQ